MGCCQERLADAGARPPVWHSFVAENLAWLRLFTLSLLKQQAGKDSLAMKRRICGWNDDFLMEVLVIKGI